jgi:aminoglycoside phosphotransferase (APT) family kinase protein
VEINEWLVRDLLLQQHPDLAEQPIRELDVGFDNVIWRVGDDLLIRMPRRELAVTPLENEQQWLPQLAPLLPLPVPVPLRIGKPSTLYSRPWSIVPWLPGEPGDLVPVADPLNAARRLGQFLRALHRPAPPSAPYNAWRSVPLAARADTFEQRLLGLETQLDTARLRRVWNAALGAEAHPRPPRWIHGDMHPGNIPIDSGTVVGVIDFGDLCAGDPATDLASVWLLLPDEGVNGFWAVYGRGNSGLVPRALGWAALFGTMLLEIGLRHRPSYEPMARAGLERVLTSSPLGERFPVCG